MPENFTQDVVGALVALRAYARKYPTMGLSEAINTLDDASVFRLVDAQTDYDVSGVDCV